MPYILSRQCLPYLDRYWRLCVGVITGSHGGCDWLGPEWGLSTLPEPLCDSDRCVLSPILLTPCGWGVHHHQTQARANCFSLETVVSQSEKPKCDWMGAVNISTWMWDLPLLFMCHRLRVKYCAKPLSGRRGPCPTEFRARLCCWRHLPEPGRLARCHSLSVCLRNRKPHWKVEVLARPQAPP